MDRGVFQLFPGKELHTASGSTRVWWTTSTYYVVPLVLLLVQYYIE